MMKTILAGGSFNSWKTFTDVYLLRGILVRTNFHSDLNIGFRLNYN